jgi:hypothetical protein
MPSRPGGVGTLVQRAAALQVMTFLLIQAYPVAACADCKAATWANRDVAADRDSKLDRLRHRREQQVDAHAVGGAAARQRQL